VCPGHAIDPQSLEAAVLDVGLGAHRFELRVQRSGPKLPERFRVAGPGRNVPLPGFFPELGAFWVHPPARENHVPMAVSLVTFFIGSVQREDRGDLVAFIKKRRQRGEQSQATFLGKFVRQREDQGSAFN
jgi:hypothetical protein